MNESADTLSDAILHEVDGLTRLYDFSENTSVSLLSESENKVYLVTDPSRTEKYVIRVNSGRLTYHNPESIASELMWMMALRQDTDILVPEVLRAKDGSLVQTIFGSNFDRPRHASIYTFLPGNEPSEEDLVAGFGRLGEISARMNQHAKNWTRSPEFSRHTWTPTVILDDQLNWGRWQDGVNIEGEVKILLTRVDGVVRERLSRLPTGRDYYGLIHADLRLANLLDDDGSTAIIDFDDCGDGWYLFDLATALSFLEERPDVPDLIASWLEGYRNVEHIPANIETEIPTLIMLRRLQLIGWVGYQQQHLEFAREIGVDFTTDSCRLAEAYLSNLG
jgi:Ser/Thr protein kinase RdoA (MazF antagonist)